MHVPKFISQIPVHMNQAFNTVAAKSTKAKDFVVNFFKARRDHFVQSDFWKGYGKPFYTRHIEPLKKKDYAILGIMLTVATAVIVVAVKIFTVAAFPLALGGAALIVLGTCSYLRSQINQHFNKQAWDHVDEIRQIADKITSQNQKFGDISEERVKMSKPGFEHLKDDLKQLDEEIRTFRKAVLSSNSDEKKKIIKTHLTVLKGIVQGNAQDTALIQALEQEVDKAGQKNQNLEALELQKQKLHELQTVPAQNHIADLQKQVNTLVKALQGPVLADSKKSFLKYVEGLQSKLQ